MKRAELRRHKPLLGSLQTARAWHQSSMQAALQRAREVAGKPTPGKRRRQRDTGPTQAVRDLIRYERAEQRCEVSGVWLGDTAGHLHHRRPRQAGGSRRSDTNSSQNLLLVSAAAHAAIESDRTRAYELGLLLDQNQDPLTEPVALLIGEVHLTDDGHYIHTEAAA